MQHLLAPRRGRILHIAVAPGWRRAGIGRHLVNGVVEMLDLCVVEAETDQEAVGFYERCGFVVRRGGGRFGTPRYECQLCVAHS